MALRPVARACLSTENAGSGKDIDEVPAVRAIQHAGEEVGYVLAGHIALIVDDRPFRLAQGDSFVFGSKRPHAHRNVGDEPAGIFWVNTPPISPMRHFRGVERNSQA